jgi:hypothetical protein
MLTPFRIGTRQEKDNAGLFEGKRFFDVMEIEDDESEDFIVVTSEGQYCTFPWSA